MNRNRRKSSVKHKWSSKDVADGIILTYNVTSSLSQLNNWRKNGELCDITIKTGSDVTIKAHRNILAVNSEYFHAMFTSGLHESSSGQVHMEAVSGELLEMVIDFMYTGQIKVEVGTAQELLMLSDMLQMEQLKQQCELYMHSHLDANNSLGMVEFGRKFSCPNLVEKAIGLIKKRFAVVVESEEFTTLPLDVLLELVKMPDLHLGAGGEDVVLAGVMRWAETEPAERGRQLCEILPHVNLPAVSYTLLNAVQHQAFIAERPDLLGLLAKKDGICKRGIRTPQQQIYAIGGFFQSRTGPSCPRTTGVERFDVQAQEWTSVASLPILPSAVFAFNVQGRLLVIAFDHHPQSNARCPITKGLLEYNYLEDSWEDLTSNISSAVLGVCEQALEASGCVTYCPTRRCLYLLTSTRFCRLAVEEVNGDLVMEGLEELAPLRRMDTEDTGRQHEDEVSLVCHQGAVYAFGGAVRTIMTCWPFDSASRYDPEGNAWSRCAPMLSSRARVGAVSLNGSIYVVGGFGKYRESCMERYDPETDVWEDVAAMAKRRSYFCAVTAGGKIWALGGKSYAFGCGGARKVLKMIESYDPETDTWTTFGPMKEARCGFATVVL